MTTKPLLADVSVIMPAYNNAETIGRALASIAAQSVKPREVIVVDDGSADNSVDVARAMAMNGIGLRIFRQHNSGAGAARNRAIAEAKGTWLAFLDADDEWLPAKLQHSLAETEPAGLTMSCHNLYGISGDEERLIDSRSRWLTNPADPYRTLFLRGFISSSTVLVRRDVVVAVGGFDTTLRSAQDYELWLAILAHAGTSFTCFDQILLRYTLAADGITSKVDRKVACSMAILRRHMGVLRRRLGGAAVAPVMLRLLIIHLEAIRGHHARRDLAGIMRHLAMLPGRALAVLCRLPFADGARPDFLAELVPADEVSP